MSHTEGTGRDRPAWLDAERYPFEDRYLTFEPGTVHYVDEGAGRPLLMLHGNPTWSFEFRHLIAGLADDYRCVAPDYLGFGLSEKPAGWSYLPADHAEVIDAFVRELELRDLTLIALDWGGPIGLDYVTRNVEDVRSVVLMNTWLWPVQDLMPRLFSGVLGSRPARRLIRRYNLFATRMMPALAGDPSVFEPEVHRHYTAPLGTPDEREPSWVFPREITGSNPWMAELWDRRHRLDDVPMRLLWGEADPGLGSYLGRWEAAFPHAEATAFPDIGHYVPDELGPEIVPYVESFLAST